MSPATAARQPVACATAAQKLVACATAAQQPIACATAAQQPLACATAPQQPVASATAPQRPVSCENHAFGREFRDRLPSAIHSARSPSTERLMKCGPEKRFARDGCRQKHPKPQHITMLLIRSWLHVIPGLISLEYATDFQFDTHDACSNRSACVRRTDMTLVRIVRFHTQCFPRIASHTCAGRSANERHVV